MKYTFKTTLIWLAVVITTTASGIAFIKVFQAPLVEADLLRLDDQEATIRAINRAIPGVVSIVVSENASVDVTDPATGQSSTQTQKVRRGAGSGFLISEDGLILTNKHVVTAATTASAEYRVTLYSGKQYYAQLIGKDPVGDLAILKIYDSKLPFLAIGDSNRLKVGMTVIAIGNALGRYDNSATKGIISGLGRNLTAGGSGGETEDLENVIQTDAEINHGNSGGPLIDLNGQVVGINVAKDEGGGGLGFSIPINEARPVISSARAYGYIIRARLGLRYQLVTPELAEERKLSRTFGALAVPGDNGEPAVLPDSPAAKAGLREGDIIFEIDGQTVDERKPLLSYINQFSPGKTVGLRVQRGDKIIVLKATLDKLP